MLLAVVRTVPAAVVLTIVSLTFTCYSTPAELASAPRRNCRHLDDLAVDRNRWSCIGYSIRMSRTAANEFGEREQRQRVKCWEFRAK